jgi:uncharacterized repeat protein (TIGR03803 family)
MRDPAQHSVSTLRSRLRAAAVALAVICELMMVVTQPTQAQTLTVLHDFTSGGDGDFPTAGLTMDRAGNFYGTTAGGGYASLNCLYGCGTVFKLSRNASSWVLTPVYSFTGGDDGTTPDARVLFGPDGLLYGTTTGDSSLGGTGKATAFSLRLPSAPCKTALCPGEETVLYRFVGPMDGSGPGWGDLAFDQAGNLYGTTSDGGTYGYGSVYELTPSTGSWTETILYSFTGGDDGSQPKSGVIFDQAGNLYGTTLFGGAGARGTVFQLTHSGSGWTEKVLHSFGSSGSGPFGGLIFDPSGNLYGTTQTGYMGLGNGTVFMLTPSGDDWTLTTLYSFPAGFTYPYARLTMDAAGNLYGTTSYFYGPGGYLGGQGSEGSVFKLAFLNGSWTYVDLHDFDGRSDGGGPFGSVILDTSGNLYGTGTAGGTVLYCSGGCGVVWEITP